MTNRASIVALFAILTILFGVLWWLTGNEFVSGLFGNMIVGLITLVGVDLLFDASLANRNRPAREAANMAALRVQGEAVGMIFGIYGAAAKSGVISAEEHHLIATSKSLTDMPPLLGKTQLRAEAFVYPPRPAIILLYQDAVGLQNSINLILSTHGQYLEPDIGAALYRLGQTRFVNDTISYISINAVPDTHDQTVYADFIDALFALREALVRAKASTMADFDQIGAYQLIGQIFTASSTVKGTPAAR